MKKTLATPAHTPTPWKLEEVFENSGDDCYISVVGDNGMTEIFIEKDYGNKSRPIREDAAFIVLAVNAHKGLLLELKFLVDAVEHGSHVDMEIALKKSKQAIAIAEGKP